MNKENNHQLKGLLIVKFSRSAAYEMYREQYKEYAYWCKGVKGETQNYKIYPSFHSISGPLMDGMLAILGYSHVPASAPSAFYQSFLALCIHTPE